MHSYMLGVEWYAENRPGCVVFKIVEDVNIVSKESVSVSDGIKSSAFI